MADLSRRAFFRQTAALGATAIAAQSIAAPNERVNLAVIGCRNRGHQVTGKCLDTGRFNLVTVCDCDSAMSDKGLEEIKDKLPQAPKVEKDFRRVLEDKEVDAVIVATPDHWHTAMSLLALDAGKHVYLEKPATYSIGEGKLLCEAEKRYPNATLLVGTQQRSAPHFAEARDFVRSGGLGKVGFARAWIAQDRGVLEKVPDSPPPATFDYDMWLGPAPERPFNKNRVHYVWRFIRDYGTGEMGNWGAHWIDTVLWLADLDYPTAVSGHGGQFVTKDGKEYPDTHTIVYEYPELTLLWEQRIWTKFPVNTHKGGSELSGDRGSLVVTRDGWTFFPKEGDPVDHTATGDMEEIHAANFADAIQGQAHPAGPMAEGHKSATLCHLGNIAAETKTRLEFDGITQTFKNDELNRHLIRKPRAPWRL